MNQEAKKKWIEALHSGMYTQGKSCLKGTDNNYCCLGVLVEVFEKHYGLKFDQKINVYYNAVEFGAYCSKSVPPDIVIDWLGITPRQQTLLMNLNDRQGCSFAGIADLLEHLD
jgi:hypothetical protein